MPSQEVELVTCNNNRIIFRVQKTLKQEDKRLNSLKCGRSAGGWNATELVIPCLYQDKNLPLPDEDIMFGLNFIKSRLQNRSVQIRTPGWYPSIALLPGTGAVGGLVGVGCPGNRIKNINPRYVWYKTTKCISVANTAQNQSNLWYSSMEYVIVVL